MEKINISKIIDESIEFDEDDFLYPEDDINFVNINILKTKEEDLL